MKSIIYTAGGFHGDWRQKFNEKFKDDFIILDPLAKESNQDGTRRNLGFPEYSAWDLWAIRTADIVFVYAEKTNPGQGYIVEAGYAKGAGKTVIIVRELENQHMNDRYLSFIDCVGDYVCHTLEDGFNFLADMAIKS